jgi:hypothetical protein
MSLTTPESIQKLHTALHAKAKESPDFRFYALYDKVYRKDNCLVMIKRPLPFGGTILSILSYRMTNRRNDATTNR